MFINTLANSSVHLYSSPSSYHHHHYHPLQTSLKRPRADAVLQRRIAELEAEETKWREQATAKRAEIARLEKEIREIKVIILQNSINPFFNQLVVPIFC